ncbi:MAG TPA: GNAT family protein, partial [Acidimicrobiales bacterium]|nr:GNAT family protein [Acidimicrobiales bacterium]
LDHETMGTGQLRDHNFVLVDHDLVLRPMTEGDWDVVLEWADDPEVLWFSEADNVEHRTREEHQAVYRAVSHTPADVFIFEVNGTPMGDGWVQRMNLARVLDANPGKDCRRVDLQLDRSWWGKGIGTRAIRLLTAHGFGHGADVIFAVDVAPDNFASQGAFQANGYKLWGQVGQPAGAKVPYRFDFLCHGGPLRR